MENNEKTTTKYYIVDYDSVKQNGLDGIENVAPEDRIFIFYTGKENTMDMSFVEKIYLCEAEIIFRKISADDSFGFIISAHTGYIAGKDKNAEIHIISSCKEYTSLNNFCTYMKPDISVQCSISGKDKKKEPEYQKYILSLIHMLKAVQKIQENKIISDVEKVVESVNLTVGVKKYLSDIIKNAIIEYPNNIEHRKNYIKKKINILPANTQEKIYITIEPYI